MMVIGRALDADDVSKRRGKRVGILRHHANPRTNSRMYCIVHGVSTYRRNNEGVVSSQSSQSSGRESRVNEEEKEVALVLELVMSEPWCCDVNQTMATYPFEN